MRLTTFGEVLLRLSPPAYRSVTQTASFDSWIGGAEANVARALAQLGHETSIISMLPDNALGNAAIAALRGSGVDTKRVHLTDKGRMGLYFAMGGAMHRPLEVLYDRAASAFAETPQDYWDWQTLLAGADRLHLTGVTAALGPGSQQAMLAASRAAGELGVAVSFDGNYRAKLWDAWDGRPGEAYRQIIAGADILFGNARDIALAIDREIGTDEEAIRLAFDAFPALKLIAHTMRTVDQGGRQTLAVRVATPEEAIVTRSVSLPAVVDRIGTGDAFAAGVLHGWADGQPLASVANSGLALACLKHALPGDAALFSLDDLNAFDGEARDVVR